MTLLLRLPGYEFIAGFRGALNEIVAGSHRVCCVGRESRAPWPGTWGILRCSGERGAGPVLCGHEVDSEVMQLTFRKNQCNHNNSILWHNSPQQKALVLGSVIPRDAQLRS